MLENPKWYTPYTPYQAEIAQGRLESLLNFQTAIMGLTGMAISNASLLDEATSAAEAVQMSYNVHNGKRTKYFLSENTFPQTIEVIKTKCHGLNIDLEIGNVNDFDFSKGKEYMGMLVQNPDNFGNINDYEEMSKKMKESGMVFTIACDILSLALTKPPGEMGADIAVGSAQRLGIPMAYGGPHPGIFATTDKLKRKMPGRVIGISKDVHGNQAFRMAMQTREQHIRRDKATSNICTAQALLANMASFYMQWHGRHGLRKIAKKCRFMGQIFIEELEPIGIKIVTDKEKRFDTVAIDVKASGFSSADYILSEFHKHGINIRKINDDYISVSFDELDTLHDLNELIEIFTSLKKNRREEFTNDFSKYEDRVYKTLPNSLKRSTPFLGESQFEMKFSETNMMRYIQRLAEKDISLTNSMIALGSCTMKLNSAIAMIPIGWAGFSQIHPFAPRDQCEGYHQMFAELEDNLIAITQYDAISLQPQSGATGEYAGLMAIRKYHESRGDHHRNICLIPSSAHGTNPATAQICGMKIVGIGCDDTGNIRLDEVEDLCKKHANNLGAIMITYPSTFGVFESKVKQICDMIHQYGGQVYLDGANMNAQMGLTSPGYIGADVGHLNLHKTFSIPHGGGGPGVGAIGYKKHLEPFVPGHAVVPIEGRTENAVSGSPYGNAGVLPISYAYIKMSGKSGLLQAAQQAIMNANYILKRLEKAYDIKYKSSDGFVAHEVILDVNRFKSLANITEEDIAKRLVDYGFHAPTMSFPVAGGLMIEPTESEDLVEIDRFCESMLKIREEIQEIIDGKQDREVNMLKLAPFTLEHATQDKWDYNFTRQQAAWPVPWLREMGKVFPYVGRIDNVYGDRNLICSCPPMSEFFTFEPGNSSYS